MMAYIIAIKVVRKVSELSPCLRGTSLQAEGVKKEEGENEELEKQKKKQ